MALPKVCGIETEYGIVVRGGDNNPVSASSMLINAYVAATNRDRGRIGWDFEDEQPTNDARGFELDTSLAPEVETMLVNAVLTNGAFFFFFPSEPSSKPYFDLRFVGATASGQPGAHQGHRRCRSRLRLDGQDARRVRRRVPRSRPC